MIEIKAPKAIIPTELIPVITKDMVVSIVGNVADSARNHWIRIAEKDTSVFKPDYILGIQPVVAEGTKHTVSLVGPVPHILEDGSPRLDMRTTLLGPNVPVAPFGEKGKRQGKQGQFYRAIPFRHTGPGAGKAVGQAMGSAYSGHEAVDNAKKLGKAVYNAAKKLEASTSTPYGKTKWGGRLDPSRIKSGLVAGNRGVPLLKPHHTTSIYTGMVRMEKTYEKATQSSYMTFRTISTAVQNQSWWRKEITARHYAEQVERFVSKILPLAFEKFIEGKKGQI